MIIAAGHLRVAASDRDAYLRAVAGVAVQARAFRAATTSCSRLTRSPPTGPTSWRSQALRSGGCA